MIAELMNRSHGTLRSRTQRLLDAFYLAGGEVIRVERRQVIERGGKVH